MNIIEQIDKEQMAAITASLLALPLPVTCRLMVPTGTPW